MYCTMHYPLDVTCSNVGAAIMNVHQSPPLLLLCTYDRNQIFLPPMALRCRKKMSLNETNGP